MDITLVYPICMLILVAYSAWIVAGQRKTIDKLTDKLMSRDYSEYKRNNHITIDDSKPQRKPISFYDDPTIDIDEEGIN